jgi:hypothetical protein
MNFTCNGLGLVSLIGRKEDGQFIGLAAMKSHNASSVMKMVRYWSVTHGAATLAYTKPYRK